MIGILKKIMLPTGETKKVDGLESWTVSWRARTGEYSGEWTMKHEVFVDKDVADDFANQLKESSKFLRDTWSRDISVKRN